MSLFDAHVHALGMHADGGVYAGADPPFCLACLLGSLADARALNTRKSYVLR